MAAVVTPDPARWFTQHLRARAASLLAEYQVASGFEHKPLRGLEREAPIRRFLLEHCPLRVLVASGSVADASKVLERQHDIVLIDATFGPTLLAGSAAALFPVESVFGIIEAKSGPELELDTVANSLLEVRGLSAAEGVARHGGTIEPGKTGPGLHVIVAFKGRAPETTAAHLEAANKNAAESQRLPIDLVLVLSRDGATLDGGYVVGYANAATAHHYYPQKGEPNLAGPVTICEGPDSFAYWFAVLMNHLVGVLAFPPVLFEYIGAPYGIVRVALPPKEPPTGTQGHSKI